MLPMFLLRIWLFDGFVVGLLYCIGSAFFPEVNSLPCAIFTIVMFFLWLIVLVRFEREYM